MAVVTDKYKLDLMSLPARDERLRIRFNSQIINGKNRLLLLYPLSDRNVEPSFVRYAVGMTLKLGDGIAVGQQGQLIVTGQRLLGMFTDGAVGGQPLNGQAGSVFAFSLDLDDVDSVTPKSNWRGKPVEAIVSSREDLDPWFVLHVFTVAALVKSDGTATPTSIGALLPRLLPEGRGKLQS